ncbi:MAG: tetratricopeptide repeat protein [Pseudomonadota bacterium]|nr:tetratricopeptide repeat protein [Pseudomonadota bacterium]|tara:strand:+ start:1606 stop:3324 length:1719 start_codon:yes stop_codon:yes gene_type:complete
MLNFLKILIAILPLFLISCNPKQENMSTSTQDKAALSYFGPEKKYTQIYNAIYINFAMQKGRYEEALALFIQNIDLMEDLKLFPRMARISLQFNKIEETSIIVDKWLELKPDSILAHNLGISASLEEADFMKTRLIFNNYLKLINQEDKSYYSRLINILSENSNRYNVVSFFEKYLEKNPNRLLTESFIELLRFYNQYTKALEYIDKIGINNDRTLVRYKASSLSAINRNQEAIELLTNYLETKKNTDRQIQFELINLYILVKDLKAAEELINKILDVDPENFELIYQIGALCYNAGSYNLSEKYFSYLLSKDLASSDVNFFLGLIDHNNGNFDEAIRHFERVKDGDRKFEAQIRKSSSIRKSSNINNAIQYLDKLMDEYKSDSLKINILLTEISLYNEEKQFFKIIDLVDKSIKRYPNNLRLIYSRAMAYESLKKINEMEEDLKYILSIDSKNSNTLNALGYSLTIHTERYNEAEKYIRKALEYDPGNAAILDSLGWVLYKKGDIKNALHYIELAYNKDQDPEIVEHFCEILIKSGFLKRSKEVMKIEIEKNPDNTDLLNKLTTLHADDKL